MATGCNLLTRGPNVREGRHGRLPPRLTNPILPGPPSGGLMRRCLVVIAITLTLTLSPPPRPPPHHPAGDPPPPPPRAKTPMGEGARPFTGIGHPKIPAALLPILMERTPYSAAGAAGGAARNAPVLGLGGYILVFQDIRGRYSSEGTFDMNRAPHSGHAGTDESTDTYDTIDWLVKNVPNNNGKVGVFGISYPGWLTAVAGIGAHRALKAISPQAPMGDAWMGDDFFHQRAFPPSSGPEYSPGVEASSDRSGTP